MPRILMEVPQDEFSAEDVRANPQAVCKHLHATAKSDVEDKLTDPEAYVPDFDEIEEGYILGAADPELLKRQAADWNSTIWRELLQAIEQFMRDAAKNAVAKADLDADLLNSTQTYALKKAALAADNSFYDFSEHFVNLPNEMGFTYLRATISDQQLADVMAKPEQYAILPIWVK